MHVAYPRIFASLSNEIRLRCLYLVATRTEVCVCEAVDALGIPQPTISRAFKTLKEAGLVTDRRDANWTYYRLGEELPEWLSRVLQSTVGELSNSEPYLGDGKRFERSRARETEAC